MLAGASGIDIALLCIAANESVMPQTEEHFQILKLLEAKSLIVALTKIDLIDQEGIELATAQVQELLRGSQYEGSQIINVSVRNGQGLEQLKSQLESAILNQPESIKSTFWFMPIDRVFTIQGHGTVVTGTVATGQVLVGEKAELLPGRHEARIRSIQIHGVESKSAEKGQRCAMNVVGVKKEELHRGQAIGSINTLVETKCINISLISIAEIKHGERVRVHLGAGEFIAKIFLFDADANLAQLRLEESVACAKGQRIILRKYSPPLLLGGGDIVTPNAVLTKKNQKISVQSENSLLDILNEATDGIETEVLCRALGRNAQQLGDEFEAIKSSGDAFSFAGIWVSHKNYKSVAETILASLLELHKETPQASHISKARLAQKLSTVWQGKPLDRLLAKLTEDGLLRMLGGELRHPDHEIELSERQRALLDKVVGAMKIGMAVAPNLETIAAKAGAPIPAIEEMMRLGVETGTIARVDNDLYYPIDTLIELEQVVRSLAPRFTVAQFRDKTGSSRKFALPLLQYFDEKRVTRRVDDDRIVIE